MVHVDSDKISSTQEYHSTGSGLTRRAARVQRAESMQVQAPRHGCTIADDPDPLATNVEPTAAAEAQMCSITY